MSTRTRTKRCFWTRRRGLALVLLLLAAGILITPLQWYVAYVGVQRAKQRRRTGPNATGVRQVVA